MPILSATDYARKRLDYILKKPCQGVVLSHSKESTSMDFRHIQFCYTETCSANELIKLRQLFDKAAFWATERDADDLQMAIAHSHPVVTAWDGEKMIGFARATSDGVYRATIWDVVIDPDYQGAGLGRKLVQTVLSHPHMSRVDRIYLMTTNQQRFYERIGFEENQTTTMVLFNEPFEDALALSREETVEVCQ